jgi:hypothetical protein
MKERWTYVLELALVMAVALFMFSDLMEVDGCVEGGGQWNEVTDRCDASVGWAFLRHGKY